MKKFVLPLFFIMSSCATSGGEPCRNWYGGLDSECVSKMKAELEEKSRIHQLAWRVAEIRREEELKKENEIRAAARIRIDAIKAYTKKYPHKKKFRGPAINRQVIKGMPEELVRLAWGEPCRTIGHLSSKKFKQLEFCNPSRSVILKSGRVYKVEQETKVDE